MERTILITGSASGMGKATKEMLAERGHRVIGVDLRDADIIADLSTIEGRTSMLRSVERMVPEGLDGVAAVAGVSGPIDPGLIISVNYFGALSTLEGLRPLLAKSRSPRALLIASTALFLPTDQKLIDMCLCGDEENARAYARENSDLAYSSSKHAITLWMRRAAVSEKWAGKAILLNAIGPGQILTAMTAPFLGTEEGRSMLAQVAPVALDRPYGEVDDVAEIATFLLEIERSFLVGQILYVDGGTDAILRPTHI